MDFKSSSTAALAHRQLLSIQTNCETDGELSNLLRKIGRLKLNRVNGQSHFDWIRSWLGLPPRLVSKTLLGRQVLVRNGTISTRPDYDDAWLYALITQCSVLFDVGSNVGQSSLLALIEQWPRTVVLMEANPSALSTAAENLLRNGFSTEFRLVLGFIGSVDDQEVQFFTVGTGQAGSKYRSHAATAAARNSSIIVKTVSLDRITRELSLAPDLIKIDIEGAEAEALNGAEEITRLYQPRYLVEMHSPRELPLKENVDLVLEWCKRVGYEAYYLKEHTKLTTSDPIAHRGRCHLLLQAKDIAYPYFLQELQQGDSLEKAMSVMKRLGVRARLETTSMPRRTVLSN